MTSESKPGDTAAPDNKPEPPAMPDASTCCGSGCDPCIYDIYWDKYARYEEALARWQTLHPDNP